MVCIMKKDSLYSLKKIKKKRNSCTNVMGVTKHFWIKFRPHSHDMDAITDTVKITNPRD